MSDKADFRPEEIEKIKDRLRSARPMDIDEILVSMISSVSDVAQNIQIECKTKGWADKRRISTFNSLMHQIYRRYEMLGNDKGRIGGADGKVKITFELSADDVQDVSSDISEDDE